MPNPTPSQVRFIRNSLRKLVETLFRYKQIDRLTRLKYEQQLRSRKLLWNLASDLYGPKGETTIPANPRARLILLSMKELSKGRFRLLVFKRANGSGPPERSFRCLVGHRFTREIQDRFRWNLRELFEPLGIDEDYSDFDGKAVNIISDLLEKIRTYDFCVFDNRETTKPSKPNVYIEAGMAVALNRPFIFCHYTGKEVWPSDFSNISYIPYKSYEELFAELYARLPLFLERNVPMRRGRRVGKRGERG